MDEPGGARCACEGGDAPARSRRRGGVKSGHRGADGVPERRNERPRIDVVCGEAI